MRNAKESNNYKYSINLQVLQTRCQFQREFISTYSQSWDSETRQEFFSLDQCNQFSMRNQEKIIRHTRIICFICEIAKFDIRFYINIQIDRFTRTFESFDYDIRYHVRICENYIKFVYKDRKNCKNFRKIDREYSNSNCLHSRKNENWTNNFSIINVRICIKIDEKIFDSTNRLRSNLQTLQTEFQFQ